MQKVNVSFVIPHKGREELLLQTLTSIADQHFDLSSIEVILVSQNKQFSQDVVDVLPNIQYKRFFCSDSLTISELRNYGVEQSDGEYIAFLDADVSLSSNWLNIMLHEIESKATSLLISAMQIDSENAPPLEKIRTALSNVDVDNDVIFLPGRNLFVRRSTFDQVGGFPAHLTTCEDYFFTGKISEIGKLTYTSKTTYVHLGEDKVYAEMYKKEIWRGQSNLASLSGRKIPIREIPSFIIPPAICVGVLMMLISILLSNFPLFLLGSIAALPPYLVYCTRLKRLVSDDVSLFHVFKFYSLYFPARTIGTIIGLLKTVKTDTHS